MEKYNNSLSANNSKKRLMENGPASKISDSNQKVWMTYKNLMFKSIVFGSDEEDSGSDIKSHDSARTSNQSSSNEEEGENLADEDASENF